MLEEEENAGQQFEVDDEMFNALGKNRKTSDLANQRQREDSVM